MNYMERTLVEKLNKEYVIEDNRGNEFKVDGISTGETCLWIELICEEDTDLYEQCSVYVMDESIMESLESQGYSVVKKEEW